MITTKDKPGKVIVITAPSGAGKTTIAKKLLNDVPGLVFSISATTRPPRAHEIHGKDYYFLNQETFDKYISEGRFIEYEEFYNGSMYGTLRSDVENQRKKGYFVLFDVEVKGAVNLKNVYGANCMSLFIKPPDMETLDQRLRSRGTETDETLQLRLGRAEMEMAQSDRFDHEIVNDDFDLAYAKVKSLLDDFMNG